MQANYVQEPGVLYDSLHFIKMKFDEAQMKSPIHSIGYMRANELMRNSHISQPYHLALLVQPQSNKQTFLQYLLVRDIPLNGLTMARAQQVIGNSTYFRRSLVEWFLPGLGYEAMQKVADLQYPDTLVILNTLDIQPEEVASVVAILANFANVQKEVATYLMAVYEVFLTIHEAYLMDNASFSPGKHEFSKLAAACGFPESISSLDFSLSIMSPSLLHFEPNNPGFFILGTDFRITLDARYPYALVNSLSYVEALSSEAKLRIFQRLSSGREYSVEELAKSEHLARKTVSQSIKQMKDAGVVYISRVESLTHYYRVNIDYLIAVHNSIEKIIEQVGSM